MKTAFSKQEQQKIITSTISTPPNPTYGTLGGQDTKDKLFLLSIDEVETYFPEKQKNSHKRGRFYDSDQRAV